MLAEQKTKSTGQRGTKIHRVVVVLNDWAMFRFIKSLITVFQGRTIARIHERSSPYIYILGSLGHFLARPTRDRVSRRGHPGHWSWLPISDSVSCMMHVTFLVSSIAPSGVHVEIQPPSFCRFSWVVIGTKADKVDIYYYGLTSGHPSTSNYPCRFTIRINR